MCGQELAFACRQYSCSISRVISSATFERVPKVRCRRQIGKGSSQIRVSRSFNVSISSRSLKSGRSQLGRRAMSSLAGDTFFLDEFAFRQFEGGHAAQMNIPKEEFVERIHKFYHEEGKLVDGYAPFCKHLFVPNFTDASVNALCITQDNEALVRSGFSKRRPDELAVLTRWFPADKVHAQKAKILDLILYSREQLTKEYDAMPDKGPSSSLPDAPWGIISIKPQDEEYETPMQPITIMR